MEIGIGVTIKAQEEKYNIDLHIPTQISIETPFCFTVSQPSQGESSGDNDILHVSFSDNKHVYVQVKPSEDLLKQANINEYVENLQAVIEEGNYNKKEKRFTDSGSVESSSNNQKQIPSNSDNEK